MQQELVIKVAWWTKKICDSIGVSRIFCKVVQITYIKN